MDTEKFLLNDEFKNCSFCEDELANNCSFNEHATCRNNHLPVQEIDMVTFNLNPRGDGMSFVQTSWG